MDKAVVLFSGGSDSTLAAALEIESGKSVDLLTFDRLGFIGSRNYTKVNFNNLKRIYKNRINIHQIISIDELHRRVCYQDYFVLLKKFGLATASLCFTKISMHWATAIYCQKNNIHRVVDGSTDYMKMYPDQNQSISHRNLTSFYNKLNITYETPIYSQSDLVEQKLYDRGIITQPVVRGTDKDYQVYYLEQVLLALFLKFYLTHHTFNEYEDVMSRLYENRLNMILRNEFKYA